MFYNTGYGNINKVYGHFQRSVDLTYKNVYL